MPRMLSAAAAALFLAAVADAQIQFENVAAAAGVDVKSYGRGAAMVDLDRDGLLDVIAFNEGSQDNFYRQNPDHSFSEMTAAWNIPLLINTWDGVVADFDNDGDHDVYIATGGMIAVDYNVLLRNDLDTTGQFTDVTATSGAVDHLGQVFGACSLDYDLDGDLDLFMCNNNRIDFIGGTHLLRNDGNLSFTNVSAAAGMLPTGDYRDASVGDIDNDGYPDIAASHMNNNNVLYHNNQDGTFTDIAASAGVQSPGKNFGMMLEDFNNDGWIDLYIAKYQTFVTEPSRLFVNNGDLTFTDVSVASGIAGQTDMGHNTGDLDADGYPDIYVGTGGPSVAELDKVYRIVPNGSGLLALDVSTAFGITAAGITRSHGTAFGDYDRDGDIDVYVNTGGMTLLGGTDEHSLLLRSKGNDYSWVVAQLRGVISNSYGVGARAFVATNGGRDVHRQVTAGRGFGNTDSPDLHFGLGADTAVDRLVVTWPSGIEQTLLQPATGSTHTVVETGLRLNGEPLIGQSVTLDLVGPEGHVADLLLGTTAVERCRCPRTGASSRSARSCSDRSRSRSAPTARSACRLRSRTTPRTPARPGRRGGARESRPRPARGCARAVAGPRRRASPSAAGLAGSARGPARRDHRAPRPRRARRQPSWPGPADDRNPTSARGPPAPRRRPGAPPRDPGSRASEGARGN